jgi:hypothetical protein
MPGIARILSLHGRPISIEELQKMCVALAHRALTILPVITFNSADFGMRVPSTVDHHLDPTGTDTASVELSVYAWLDRIA